MKEKLRKGTGNKLIGQIFGKAFELKNSCKTEKWVEGEYDIKLFKHWSLSE